MNGSKVLNCAAVCVAAGVLAVGAQTPECSVKINTLQPGHAIPKTLYGIFFEDINYAADGGIYPELLANRGFDWQTKGLEGWERDARGDGMARITRQYGKPVHEATAAHLRIEAFGAGEGVGIRNRGYHGIHVEAGKKYDLSFYARGLDGYRGNLRAVLESDGRVICEYTVKNSALKIGRKREGAIFDLPDWRRFTAVFAPAVTVDNATFSILMDQPGTVELEQVSLFPQDTFNGRKNGLRPDLVQLLKDLKPGIMRFPGGCLTEGQDWPLWYDWKLSVGDGSLESRSCIWNTWGYWQSMGLGYFEYFCLCEDIGAEPLPVMNAGLTCQFAKPWDLAPMDSMEYFAQNFCDLIEFANGHPKKTKWGALRAKMGHPEPFNMKYLGIGNENWGREFLDRYQAIAAIVRQRHPEIRLVSSAGAGADGQVFDLAWKTLGTDVADVIDEHYYVGPDWLLNSSGRYDKYDRSGAHPKVYAGEYACHVSNRDNNLYAALCEAAMISGFERNSDVVEMTSYAPLFCKIGGTQWKTDLIWFDNAKSFGTPSYYVQKMYANNLPTRLVPSESNVAEEPAELKGRVALQTWNTAAEFKDIKVTGADGKVLYQGLPDPAKCSKGNDGHWEIRDGVLRQTVTDKSDTAIRFGDANWSNYTLSFKAKRIGGLEAFMPCVLVDGHNGSRFLRMNLGGWGNTGNEFEPFGYKVSNTKRLNGSFEMNRWYDIALEVRDGKVTVTVDGTKLTDTTVTAQPVKRFFQTCGYDEKAGELVVKLVNVSEAPRSVNLSFDRQLTAGEAKVQTLAGQRDWVNSIAEPEKCATRNSTVSFPGGKEWRVQLPASSFTVYRIKM